MYWAQKVPKKSDGGCDPGHGKSLEMQITAEVIELMEAARWLSEHGCDSGHGWLFGMPALFTGAALQEYGTTLNRGVPLSDDNRPSLFV